MLFTNLIQTNLQTSFIGKNIDYCPFTDSTNDDAFELISNNEAENGMMIITDYQKKVEVDEVINCFQLVEIT